MSAKNASRIDVADTIELERELYSRSFRDYVPDAFEAMRGGIDRVNGVRSGRYPPEFTRGWHIDAVAEHLQAVADSQIRYLLINIPPGTMKSVETCVLWPTWMWGRTSWSAAKRAHVPLSVSHRFIFSSYSEDFAKRDTRNSKLLMQTDWYRTVFPHVQLKAAPDTMLEHHNTAGGERHGASTNSGVTGKHVHGIVEDDPLKAQDAQSERAREEAWFYRTSVLSSRLLPEAGWRVVVMQRLHEKDPSGRILAERDGAEYVHLNLPMEFEPNRKCVTYVNASKLQSNSTQPAPGAKPFFEDPRKEAGELLWPARMNARFVAEKKSPVTGLGENQYAGQYQQRPAPAEGSIIKRDWLRYYRSADLPKLLANAIFEQSWDLIFDGDGVGSCVVGQVWARAGANHYLLHQFRERIDFPRTLRAFIEVTRAWPRASRKKVEKKANGAALIAVLRDKIPGIVAVKPAASKAARTDAVSPLFEAGNVWLPDPQEQPWILSFIEELVGITSEGPTTATDDQCDACTQYLSDKGFNAAKSFRLDLGVGISPSNFVDPGTAARLPPGSLRLI